MTDCSSVPEARKPGGGTPFPMLGIVAAFIIGAAFLWSYLQRPVPYRPSKAEHERMMQVRVKLTAPGAIGSIIEFKNGTAAALNFVASDTSFIYVFWPKSENYYAPLRMHDGAVSWQLEVVHIYDPHDDDYSVGYAKLLPPQPKIDSR